MIRREIRPNSLFQLHASFPISVNLMQQPVSERRCTWSQTSQDLSHNTELCNVIESHLLNIIIVQFFNLKVLDKQFLIALHTTIRQVSLIFHVSQMEKVKGKGVKWLDHKPSNSRSWKYRPWYRKVLEQMLNFQYRSIQYSNTLTEEQNTTRKILQSSHSSPATEKGILALTCHLTAYKESLIHLTKILHSLLSAHFSQVILIQVLEYYRIWCSGKKRADFDFLKTYISAC